MNYVLPRSSLVFNRFGTSERSAQPRNISSSKLIVLGNAYHRAGDLARAETIFRIILGQKPDQPAALLSLGIIARQNGRSVEAIRLIERAIAIAPNYHQAHNNLGTVYTDAGRIADAIDCYRRAINLKRDYAEAYYNLGVAYQAQHKPEDALEALSTCRRLTPKRADVHYEIGQCEQKLGHRIEAQIAFNIALHLDPKHARARDSLARIRSAMGHYAHAIEEFERALEDDPKSISAMNGLGEAMKRVGRFEDGLLILQKAYAIDPRNPETLLNIGAISQCIGDVKVAAAYFEQMLSLHPSAEAAEKSILFAALNRTDLDTEDLFQLHRRLRSVHDRPDVSGKTFEGRCRDPERKLRVGFVSSDFRTHVVALNMLPLIGNYDRSRFDVFLYAQEKSTDQLTKTFRDATQGYRAIDRHSNEEVARMVEEDEIDILVILAGRFDENRPLIVTHRAAPIQVSFHDCATSGLEAMDYWLTDSILHPHDTPEKFTEQLYRLPVYYQYPAQDGLPAASDLPARRNGFVTFGSFNKPEKINDEVIALWSDVLRAVPNSKLLLKYFSYYSEPSMQRRWLARFAKYGIGEDRLTLMAKTDNRPNHLTLYNDVDIALDPFPFNGATTTFEALSMCVPVVALLGRHFVDRVAASMVTHAGYPDLVAQDRNSYIALARNLAGDLDRLQMWRETMRVQLHSSPLCNGPVYTRNIEAAFRDMWRTWCETGGYRGK